MNSVRGSSSIELQDNKVCYILYLNDLNKKNNTEQNRQRKQSFFSNNKDNEYLVKVEFKINNPFAFNKNQDENQYDDNNFIYIQELSHYNQISTDQNQFSEEFLKNFYHKKLQLTFKTDCDRMKFNENHLCVSGALASILILNQRYQITSEAQPFLQSLVFSKNELSQNTFQSLVQLLFKQNQMYDTWFNQLVKLLSSYKGYLDILSFFIQKLKKVDLKEGLEENSMNQILQYFSESFNVCITINYEQNENNSQTFYPSQYETQQDSKENEQTDQVIPFIIIKKLKDAVDVYFIQPFFNIILEQRDYQETKPIPIDQLKYEQSYNLVENVNQFNKYSEYVKTNNPFQCIVSLTFVNMIQYIMQLTNDYNSKAEKKEQKEYNNKSRQIFGKFKEPFFQKESDENSSSIISSKQEQNNFKEMLEAFEKIINNNLEQKLDNKSIQLLSNICKSFEQNFQKIAYEFFKQNKIKQKKQICLSSNEIYQKLREEYYENLLPSEFYPNLFINQQEYFVLIPKILKNQVIKQTCWQKLKDFCSYICYLITFKCCRVGKMKQEKYNINQSPEGNQDNNLRQNLIDDNQQKQQTGLIHNQNPFFLIVFDEVLYVDQMHQQNRQAKSSCIIQSKRGTSQFIDNSSQSQNENNLSETLLFQPQKQLNYFIQQDTTLNNNQEQIDQTCNGLQPKVNQQNQQEEQKQNEQALIQNQEQDNLLIQQNELQQKDLQTIQKKDNFQESQIDLQKQALEQLHQQQQQQQQQIEEMQKKNKEFEANLLKYKNKLLNSKNYQICDCGKRQEVFYKGFQQCQSCLIKKFNNYC
ncbi:hypothetical protein ABPG74_001499 [Tetrahymena malaccensis]